MMPGSLPAAGDLIGGKYRVDALCASGGMAAIFSGQHLVLGQRVAIKVMLAESVHEAAVERFMREAQAAARVETEHVTRVMDAGLLDNGLPFLVMEFLEGCDLAALLTSRGPLPYGEVVDLMLEALEGLAHVHAAGIVHRDLKPSNLFLARRPDGTNVVKLLDFGVSKSLVEPADDRVKALTGNVVIGSPVYMSPEQVRSARSVDARSDLWSIAVSIYELVTGALPFDGDGVGEVLAQILDGYARPMRAHRPEVPEGLDAVVAGCFQRDREMRPADVAELARSLAPFGGRGTADRLRKIESTLVNAPLSRTPTSLGSLHTIRATQVERSSDVIVPPGQRREGSGAFALSRTYVDVAAPVHATRASRGGRLVWAAGAFAILLMAGTGTYGLAHSAQAPARVKAAAMALAPVAAAMNAAVPVQPPPSASAAPAQAPRDKEREPPRVKTPARRFTPGPDRPAFLKSRK
jgi:serine/threonine-protein kinase